MKDGLGGRHLPGGLGEPHSMKESHRSPKRLRLPFMLNENTVIPVATAHRAPEACAVVALFLCQVTPIEGVYRTNSLTCNTRPIGGGPQRGKLSRWR